jgi:hypothetical protein
MPEPTFNAGNFRLQGTGSPTLPPFDFSFSYPSAFPDNFPTIVFPSPLGTPLTRSRDLTFSASWSQLPDYHVQVDVFSSNSQLNQEGHVICRYPASQPSITIPSRYLRRLPPSDVQNGAQSGTIAFTLIPNRWLTADFPGGGRIFQYGSRTYEQYTNVKIE